MPLFMVMLKWKPEDEMAVMKEYMAVWTAVCEGKWSKSIELCASYQAAQQRWILFKAPSKEDLEKQFDKLPTVKKYTEFVPIVQSYPPSMEYVLALTQMLIKAASK